MIPNVTTAPLADAVGWVLLLVTFLVPLFVRELRQRRGTLVAYLVVMVVHQAVAITNGFFFTTYGAGADGLDFYFGAVRLVETGLVAPSAVGGYFYEYALAVVFDVFGVSLFLASQLSNLAFSLACVLVVKTMSMLGAKRYATAAVLLFGLTPATIAFLSVQMREPFQLLFFLGAVYYGLRFHIHQSMSAVVGGVASASAMALFHNGLLPFAPVLLAVLFLWPVRTAREGGVGVVLKRFVIGSAMVLLGAWFFVLASRGAVPTTSSALEAVVQGDASEYAGSYRTRGAVGRTDYGVTLDTSTPARFAVTAVPALVYYLFSPFPWQVRSALDAVALVESLLRLVLFWGSLLAIRDSRGSPRRVRVLLLVIYIGMALLWALGTKAYGTGIRHNLVHYWIVVVLGTPHVASLDALAVRRPASGRQDAPHGTRYSQSPA